MICSFVFFSKGFSSKFRETPSRRDNFSHDFEKVEQFGPFNWTQWTTKTLFNSGYHGVMVTQNF